MIETTFTVSEAEYIDMQKAHSRLSTWKRVRQRLLIGSLACASIYSAFELAKLTTADGYFLIATLPSVVLLIGLARAPFNSKTYLRNRFKKAAPQLSNIHVQIDQDGYRHDVPERTHGVLYWPAFSSWMESPRVIALLRGELMYPIPKAALSEDQQNELRTLLQASINPN